MTMRRWVDWVNVIIGVWLFASPWLLTVVAGAEPAAWSSWSVGAGIVTLALFSMYKPAVWRDTVGIILGAWLMASPWLLGFDSARAAALNAVVVGLLVIGYALWAMHIDTTSWDRRRGGRASMALRIRRPKQCAATRSIHRHRRASATSRSKELRSSSRLRCHAEAVAQRASVLSVARTESTPA